MDRQFLYKIMEKLGYSKIFINFIKKTYHNTMSVIYNNGFSSHTFVLSRGVRQGCSLSLLLYIINGEVINLNIKRNRKIIDYPIPNKKQTHKLMTIRWWYQFFRYKRRLTYRILKVFQKYQIATGATMMNRGNKSAS